MSFGQYATAAMMRDVTEGIARDVIQRERPAYRYATVDSVNETTRRAMVTYAGELTPVPVRYSNSVRPVAGSLVRVDGLVGDRHTSQVIDGGARFLADTGSESTPGYAFNGHEQSGTYMFSSDSMYLTIGGEWLFGIRKDAQDIRTKLRLRIEKLDLADGERLVDFDVHRRFSIRRRGSLDESAALCLESEVGSNPWQVRHNGDLIFDFGTGGAMNAKKSLILDGLLHLRAADVAPMTIQRTATYPASYDIDMGWGGFGVMDPSLNSLFHFDSNRNMSIGARAQSHSHKLVVHGHMLATGSIRTNEHILADSGFVRGRTLVTTHHASLGSTNAAWYETGLATKGVNSSDGWPTHAEVLTINEGSTRTGQLIIGKNSGFWTRAIDGNGPSWLPFVQYATTSDRRAKKNIEMLADKDLYDIALQLKPAKYDFIFNAYPEVGFISQDVEEVIPIAVHGAADAVDEEDGEPSYQTLQYNSLVAVLAGAVKHLASRLESDEIIAPVMEAIEQLDARLRTVEMAQEAN